MIKVELFVIFEMIKVELFVRASSDYLLLMFFKCALQLEFQQHKEYVINEWGDQVAERKKVCKM